jgi:hypothetical protein
MYYPDKSLKNAKNLLDSHALEDVVSLRLEPEPTTCCCSHCWPLVWQQVNDLIHPQGPVEHEGQALIKIDSNKCVLVQNESGPEILASVAVSVVVSVDVNALIDTVIKLISTMCSSLAKERKQPSRISLVKRRFVKKVISEEILLQIDISNGASADCMKAITKVVQNIFSKKG